MNFLLSIRILILRIMIHSKVVDCFYTRKGIFDSFICEDITLEQLKEEITKTKLPEEYKNCSDLWIEYEHFCNMISDRLDIPEEKMEDLNAYLESQSEVLRETQNDGLLHYKIAIAFPQEVLTFISEQREAHLMKLVQEIRSCFVISDDELRIYKLTLYLRNFPPHQLVIVASHLLEKRRWLLLLFASWKKISKIEMLSATKQIELAELMYYLGDIELDEVEETENASLYPTVNYDVRVIVKNFIAKCKLDE